MPTLSFTQAWRAYCRAETRLPAKPAPVAPEQVAEVEKIADRFDLVVLDAWGVLNIADQPISTARSAVAALRGAGKRLLILSNDGTRRGEEAAARHRRRGFDFAAEEIVAGIDLLPEILRRIAPGPVGLIADPPAPFPDLTAAMVPLGDDPAAYEGVAAILFLSSDDWSEARQKLLTESLRAHPRPLVVGNPDIASPEPGAMAAEPGFYGHRVAEATLVSPIFCGKPFPSIYSRVATLHPDIAPERVLCVGDTLHTDILGARAAGYRSLLVTDGFCRGQDVMALAAESGIWPDFIAPRL